MGSTTSPCPRRHCGSGRRSPLRNVACADNGGTPMQRIFALLAVLAATTGGAAAQTYPNKPVKMVVPWPAGGVAHICARAIGEEMRGTLRPPGIIENPPGASSKDAAQA